MEGGKNHNDENDEALANNNYGRSSVWGDVSQREKIIIVLIIVLAFSSIFLGYYALSRNIGSSLFNKMIKEAGELACPDGKCNLNNTTEDDLALKSIDTDQDGLFDYDELYVYKTSPYLADSDGDGYSDKEEIDKGFDPNCVGESCRTGLNIGNISVSAATTSSVPRFITNPMEDNLLGAEEIQFVRNTLLANGIPAEQVNALSDAQIQLLYYQSLTDVQNGNATSTASLNVDSSTLDQATVNRLKNLSASDIRKGLLAKGVSEEVLNKISDEELKTLFLEQINTLLQQ